MTPASSRHSELLKIIENDVLTCSYVHVDGKAAVRSLIEQLETLRRRLRRRIESDDSMESGHCDCVWCVEDRPLLLDWVVDPETGDALRLRGVPCCDLYPDCLHVVQGGSNPASKQEAGNMGGVLHQERADHLRRAVQNQDRDPVGGDPATGSSDLDTGPTRAASPDEPGAKDLDDSGGAS